MLTFHLACTKCNRDRRPNLDAYFASPIDDHDTSLFQFKKGGSEGQQICEALAMLVGLRLWCDEWKDLRTTVEVRGDSVSAPTLVMFCRTKGKSAGIIAREIALDVAESVYRPDLGAHIPGTMNVAADHLSRLFDPTRQYTVPHSLQSARRDFPRRRTLDFYRSLRAPPAPQSLNGKSGGGASK